MSPRGQSRHPVSPADARAYLSKLWRKSGQSPYVGPVLSDFIGSGLAWWALGDGDTTSGYRDDSFEERCVPEGYVPASGHCPQAWARYRRHARREERVLARRTMCPGRCGLLCCGFRALGNNGRGDALRLCLPPRCAGRRPEPRGLAPLARDARLRAASLSRRLLRRSRRQGQFRFCGLHGFSRSSRLGFLGGNVRVFRQPSRGRALHWGPGRWCGCGHGGLLFEEGLNRVGA